MTLTIKSKLDTEAKPKFFKAGGRPHYRVDVWLDGTSQELAEIESVVYKLHESFKNSERSSGNRASNFRISVRTYGEFDMKAKINFVDSTKASIELDGRLEFGSRPTTSTQNPLGSLQEIRTLLTETRSLLNKQSY